ncbi:DUF6879 family protein [Sinosporangium siamense]|uniref:DUF6879 domain-containing protein n=1 Tax=Sinosporangium siamense TaxID=1367973 RepID=A0A919RBX9_9ACTN|nr:DUF6879 family protein [Sinosporangium siamense]GII90627.1 hypothetical protein Ssi02_08580 [Sinosporangium siamense]
MKLITGEARREFFHTFRREALHLEMRDTYGTQVEQPHLKKWESGERDEGEWLQPWFRTVRAATEAGKSIRRARIVSEPVTDYQRWVLSDSHLFTEAGEQIVWIPRRRVSAIPLPGNDFWLFDEETVIFSVFAGTGEVVERQLSVDPDVVQLCKAAFEAVWPLGIPDHEYNPA